MSRVAKCDVVCDLEVGMGPTRIYFRHFQSLKGTLMAPLASKFTHLSAENP
jgi:hypothetical protein